MSYLDANGTLKFPTKCRDREVSKRRRNKATRFCLLKLGKIKLQMRASCILGSKKKQQASRRFSCSSFRGCFFVCELFFFVTDAL